MTGRLKQSDPSLLSKEEGAVRTPWHDRLSICLAYPSPYRTGMSNLGFQTLYALFNGTPSFLCERVFLPDPGDEASFSPGSTPLVSMESGCPLRDFDIVAFSVSFENDYPNILKMLEMGRIPLVAAARKEGDPLVIGGGISLILNPEPLAPFFDLFLLGEAEAADRDRQQEHQEPDGHEHQVVRERHAQPEAQTQAIGLQDAQHLHQDR